METTYKVTQNNTGFNFVGKESYRDENKVIISGTDNSVAFQLVDGVLTSDDFTVEVIDASAVAAQTPVSEVPQAVPQVPSPETNPATDETASTDTASTDTASTDATTN